VALGIERTSGTGGDLDRRMERDCNIASEPG
jgi:hypothetical protein